MIRCLLREQYKVELRMRNHSTLTRQNLIEAVADSVPKQLKVDLESPEVFVLVEVFKVRHQLLISSATGPPSDPIDLTGYHFFGFVSKKLGRYRAHVA